VPLRLTWGIARWLAIVLGLLIVACGVDWLVDRRQDTPLTLRAAMLVVQLLVAITAAYFFLLRPLGKRLGDSTLALRVEEKHRAFRHRLISAVQRNQECGNTQGMSRELISVVTREAEQQARQVSFPAVADHRRLRWSAAVAGPALGLAALLVVLISPSLALTLLNRQLLFNDEIPRSVYLES